MKIKHLLAYLLISTAAYSQPNSEFNNTWQLGFTFGEIPILAGSFKPGITVGYNFNSNFMAELTIQLKDYLQRGDESFNAQNIGFDGLTNSSETTGSRIFFGLRYKPWDWSPYLTAGFVYNNEDVETMTFDKRERIIGENTYNTNVKIVQTRGSGIAPAFGFGYQYDFNNGISLNTSFAMAFLTDIATPEVEISSDEPISESDLNSLKEKIINVYDDNFHNRYHIFNLGISYRFN